MLSVASKATSRVVIRHVRPIACVAITRAGAAVRRTGNDAVVSSSSSSSAMDLIPSTTIIQNNNTTRRVLSTAAAAASPSPQRRRTLETKNPIVLTERAADRIKEILNGDSASGALGIRVGVKRRGCNGLSYTLNYAYEKPDKDIEMESRGVTVYIEPMALFNVVGTVMDWEESELASEFTFNNPNSKGECGCGESFTV